MILDVQFAENSQTFHSSFGEVYEINDASQVRVPTKTSDLQNDSGFLTEDDVNKLLNNDFKPAKIGWVTLLADAWQGQDNLYHQIVEIEGVTENSQIDLTPSVQQLAVFYEKDLAFVTENYNGTVTVYAIGQKPTNDYTMQVTITEVDI